MITQPIFSVEIFFQLALKGHYYDVFSSVKSETVLKSPLITFTLTKKMLRQNYEEDIKWKF